MTCAEALAKKGVEILEIHPEGEFICRIKTGSGSPLEELDFWDYSSPLSTFDLRPPWWKGKYDPEDETIFLVMGDPRQEV